MSKTLSVIAHHFCGGVYAKSMLIPEDYEVVSHKHLFDHMSILTSGQVIVEADGVQTVYFSPSVIEIKAGVAHSVTPVNGDAHWLCVHATDCTDVDKVDNVLIEPVKKSMVKIGLKFNTSFALKELNNSHWLWNQHTFRTKTPGSSHREVDDIFLRYKHWELPIDQANTHESVWYPAIDQLPSVKEIISHIMFSYPESAELGGCLITKIPPGNQVYPHSDKGTWHSEYYNKKVLVLLQSAPGQSFNFDRESHEGENGEVFEFDNMPIHGVVNNSTTDRISLILAIRDITHE